jgi:hypothetical protein
LKPEENVSEWAENQLTWSFLILVLNRQEHREKNCLIENWIDEYVPLGVMGQSISEYLKSEGYKKALNNTSLHQGMLNLTSALLGGTSKRKKDDDPITPARTSIKHFAEGIYKISQDIFYNRFILASTLCFSIINEIPQFIESLGMLQNQDLENMNKIEFRQFSRFSLLSAAMLYDIVDKAGPLTFIGHKDNCLPKVSGFFYDGTPSLKDRGIRILPGDKGLILSLAGNRPLAIDINGNLVDIDKLGASLTEDGRIIKYKE